jgi:hypothetical protein
MDLNQISPEDFSLSEGGPFFNALVKTRLINHPAKLALIISCITWLPLVIITVFEGTVYSGTTLPFLKDIAIQARIMVAIPILIMIRVTIDGKVNAVIRYFSVALLGPEEQKIIVTTALRRAKKLTNSAVSEIILAIIVVIYTISLVKTSSFGELQSGAQSWMAVSQEGLLNLTFAGQWAVFVSIPIFQFLFFRWIWRYFVWVLLLFRLARARLILRPTHPDKAGGLGIVMQAQRSFNMLFVAGSVVVSGELMIRLINNPESFLTVRNEIVGYIIICIILVLLPLLFFMGKLIKTKQEALIDMSKLGAELSSKFEREWESDEPIEKRVAENEVDPSMLVDYIGVFDSVQQMRPFPITLRDIIGLAIPLFVPFVPLLIIHFSVVELLQKILKLLV